MCARRSGRALQRACVCSGGEESVWLVCRPCAGLWGVDCGALNRSRLMLRLGIWLWCVPLCLRTLAVSLCLRFPSSQCSPFCPCLFTFSFFSSLSLNPLLRCAFISAASQPGLSGSFPTRVPLHQPNVAAEIIFKYRINQWFSTGGSRPKSGSQIGLGIILI